MSEFLDYLHEVFSEFGHLDSRAMFGGHGIYHQGVMFGLVADDELYLKADNETRPQFEQEGLAPFEYIKNGKPFKMPYYRAPERIFDDPDAARYWAQLAFNTAWQAALKKRNRKR